MLMKQYNIMKMIDGRIRKYILYVIIILSVLTAVFYLIFNSPNIYLLTTDSNASWIRLPEPYILHARMGSESQTVFYRKFNIDKVIDKSTLILRAFKSPSVFVNDKEISSANDVSDNWKKRRYYDFTSALKKGDNEIRIIVKNRNSHPAVWAYCNRFSMVREQRRC